MSIVIAVIDDDAAVLDSFQALLEISGYAVVAYSSAESFLADPARKHQCLIVDQHMPAMSGIELMEYLRGAGDTTPAFMVTGRSDRAICERASRLRLEVFSKPIAQDLLFSTIEHAVRCH